MTLSAGTRLGVYEIHAAIGAGGMGEVYRARDTRLQRDVALKILPEAFAADPERLARFEREAQMLAALNHPNIATIHGIEEGPAEAGHYVRALVLELVDGETLDERIASGAIPLDESLAIARQIVDALEAAHEQGIVHRDLKPSNVKVRGDGTVKVLDFGLAKLAVGPANRLRQGSGGQEAGPYEELTLSPTITTPAMTQLGVILGTAAYMSPEQAKGREADKRSDVWAFGAVLYEMLTGKRAFDGDDMSDTLASVLKIDPDWTRLPADVPPALRALLQRCLAKDRRQRVSDVSAAKFVLDEHTRLSETPAAAARAATAPPVQSRLRWVWPAAAATLLTAIFAGTAAWVLRPTVPAAVVSRFSFTLPEGQVFSNTGRQVLAISRDGTQIVYVANQRLFLRSIGDLDAHAIPGAESDQGITSPLFEPGGQSIVFFALSDTPSLRRIPLAGGAPSILSNVNAPSGGNWGSAGILIGQQGGNGQPGEIVLVPSNGGMPERLITAGEDERIYGPQILPDGKTLLFTVAKGGAQDRWEHAQIVVQPLSGGTRRVLIENASDARYLPTGHLLYAMGGTMFAVSFDPGRLVLTGTGVPVVVGVRRATAGQTASAHLVVSDTGTLVYRPGPVNVSSTARGLVLADEQGGAAQALRVPPALYSHPRVSPNGGVLAVSRTEGTMSDVMTYDLSGKSEITRLTFDGKSRYPVWADNRRVTFQSTREGDAAIWWQSLESGNAERLTKPAADQEHVPESWSPDGRYLLFSVIKKTMRTLWVLRLDNRSIEPFSKGESAESFSATFSPDGKFVAYARTPVQGPTRSVDRGVFVEPFPATGKIYQAPRTAIDYHPVWSGDGKSIYYVSASTRPVVAVPITLSPTVVFGRPVDMVRLPRANMLSSDFRGYDVLRDGRFVSLSTGIDETQSTGGEVRVVLNWFEELKRLVPVK